MPGIASDLAERLWLAELWLLEKWETVGLDENGEVPDVHTDQEKKAIDRLAVLRAHVDTVPASQLSKAEELRTRLPHVFEKVSCHFASIVGFGYYPESAADFVHSLNEEIERIESYLTAASTLAHSTDRDCVCRDRPATLAIEPSGPGVDDRSPHERVRQGRLH